MHTRLWLKSLRNSNNPPIVSMYSTVNAELHLNPEPGSSSFVAKSWHCVAWIHHRVFLLRFFYFVLPRIPEMEVVNQQQQESGRDSRRHHLDVFGSLLDVPSPNQETLTVRITSQTWNGIFFCLSCQYVNQSNLSTRSFGTATVWMQTKMKVGFNGMSFEHNLAELSIKGCWRYISRCFRFPHKSRYRSTLED